MADLTEVLQRQGLPAQTFGDGPDLTGDGAVDMEDLTLLLSNFGTICPE